MKDNTIVLLAGLAAVTILGIAGLFTGHPDLALLAGGAAAGLLGGHLNGTQATGGT